MAGHVLLQEVAQERRQAVQAGMRVQASCVLPASCEEGCSSPCSLHHAHVQVFGYKVELPKEPDFVFEPPKLKEAPKEESKEKVGQRAHRLLAGDPVARGPLVEFRAWAGEWG